MSKQITVRFEPDSNIVGEDCLERYESAVRSGLADAFPGMEINLKDDSPFGTKVEYFDGSEYISPYSDEHRDVESVVNAVLDRIGNKLAEICR